MAIPQNSASDDTQECLTARQEVERLTNELVDIAHTLPPAIRDKIWRTSYKITIIANAYLEPSVKDDWLKYGLTPTECRFMNLLATKAGKIVKRSAIMDAMYFDTDDAAEPKVMDVLICKIRKKLAKHQSPWEILTVWGQGYRAVLGHDERYDPMAA